MDTQLGQDTEHGVTRWVLVFLLMAVALPPRSPAWPAEQATPKLVWEKEFDKPIFAVGVDEECLRSPGSQIDRCLKWILFTWRLQLIDDEGRIMLQPVEGEVHPSYVSAGGRYFVAANMEGEWSESEKGVRYVLYDWDGKVIWEIRDAPSTVVVWDDGRTVFLREKRGVRDTLDIKFIDTDGRTVRKYDLGREGSLFRVSTNLSAGFCVVQRLRVSGHNTYDATVFGRNGRVIWKKGELDRRFGMECLEPYMARNSGVVVSDCGRVVLVLYNNLYWSRPGARRLEPGITQVFVYDESGDLRDSLLLPPTGPLFPLKTKANLAFLSTRPNAEGRSFFFCYDSDRMKKKFLLEATEGRSFGKCDIDNQAGLIAVAVHSYKEGDVIRVYDLEGNLRTRVPVVTHSRDHFWFRWVAGTLLVAEGSALRQYEVNIE